MLGRGHCICVLDSPAAFAPGWLMLGVRAEAPFPEMEQFIPERAACILLLVWCLIPVRLAPTSVHCDGSCIIKL